MTIISKQVILPKITVNTVWERADLGEEHPIVGIAGIVVLDENEQAFESAVLSSLEAQGLIQDGQVSPELTDTLRLIANAKEEYYAWVDRVEDGSSGAVLLAAGDQDAVRLLSDYDAVVITPISKDELAKQFVDTIGSVEPADIAPLSVPKAQFNAEAPAEEADPEADSFDFAYDSDDGKDPADELRDLVSRRRLAVAQIYAAKRVGGQRLSCGPYSAIDIANTGRILTYVSQSASGEEVIMCVPGDKETLVKELEAANAALTSPPH
jgi:hypothetical protein